MVFSLKPQGGRVMIHRRQKGWVYIALTVAVILAVGISGFLHYITDGDIHFLVAMMLMFGVGVVVGGIIMMSRKSSPRRIQESAIPQPPVVNPAQAAIPDHLQPSQAPPSPQSGSQPAEPQIRDARYDALLPEGFDPSRDLGEQTVFFKNQGKFEEAPPSEEEKKKKARDEGLQEDSSVNPISFEDF